VANILFSFLLYFTLFTFVDIGPEDSGLYTCTAVSESGETSWSASLTVDKTGAATLHRMADPSSFPAPPTKLTVSFFQLIGKLSICGILYRLLTIICYFKITSFRLSTEVCKRSFNNSQGTIFVCSGIP